MNDFFEIKSKLFTKLGKPYYETNRCVLFCGDALKFLKKIDNEYFDAIITSPPYNIGKEYEKVKPLEEYINVHPILANFQLTLLID